ncbi:MerR family DNA-binding transcriptional regulator [Anaerobutyricum soehngenii]|nr:MerR family DNA-binding transcriptional regulator [Anaerobutyricum soehngenii]
MAYSKLQRKVRNLVKRIEEVCRLSGVSRRTLQYYDKEYCQ